MWRRSRKPLNAETAPLGRYWSSSAVSGRGALLIRRNLHDNPRLASPRYMSLGYLSVYSAIYLKYFLCLHKYLNLQKIKLIDEWKIFIILKILHNMMSVIFFKILNIAKYYLLIFTKSSAKLAEILKDARQMFLLLVHSCLARNQNSNMKREPYVLELQF